MEGMMSEEEIDKRLAAVLKMPSRYGPSQIVAAQYAIAVLLCHKHQFTAAAEGLLEAAERMVGIEREEARAEA